MIEPKHTPGPWLLTEDSKTIYALNDDVTNRFYAGVKGGFIYQTRNFTVPTPGYEIISNARLMCVAPQLLEALIELMKVLRPNPHIDYDHRFDDPMKLAEKAIAAATGEA